MSSSSGHTTSSSRRRGGLQVCERSRWLDPLMLVNDRASALEAIEIIIHEGEGVADERWADPDHRELTHYYKFEQLANGTTPIGDVWPVLDNPRTRDLPEGLQGVSNLFNALRGLRL